jgi:hypothetical protein
MSIKKFSQESGFKVLAMARLSPVEYSIVLYLINCAASNLDEVITTDSELATLIGYRESEIREALEKLTNRQIVKLKYGTPHANPDIDSLRLGMQFNIHRWILDFEKDVTSRDAVVFPFRRQGQAALQLYREERSEEKASDKPTETWRRVFDSFVNGRSLDDEEVDTTEAAAKMLVDTHPVDQVLLLVRHFGGRIPTLSLLASSWQHYQEAFEDETQKVDLLGARQKHLELDQKVRDLAKAELDNTNIEFSADERTVLEILAKHRHPRRQLFWAYQMRSRYPSLADFFEKNSDLMLAVTSSGKVIKKPLQPEE